MKLLPVGNKAPGFDAVDQDGRPISLKSEKK